MFEGNVYKVKVEQSAAKVVMWLPRRPKVRGEGSDWTSAEERLMSEICLRLGDGEPVLSYAGVVPTIEEDRPLVNPRWAVGVANGDVSLWWNTPLLTRDGVCGECGAIRGERTNEPLAASGGANGDYGTGEFRWDSMDRSLAYNLGYMPLVVSEAFVGLLTERELAACEWRAVTPARRARRRFFECIPRRVVRPVGHRQWEHDFLLCTACGGGYVRTSPRGKLKDWSYTRVTEWIGESDLESAAGDGVFAFGEPCSFSLVWPIARALALAGSENSGGLTLHALGVIPEADIERTPGARPRSREGGFRRADQPDLRVGRHEAPENPVYPRRGG